MSTGADGPVDIGDRRDAGAPQRGAASAMMSGEKSGRAPSVIELIVRRRMRNGERLQINISLRRRVRRPAATRWDGAVLPLINILFEFTSMKSE